MKGIILLQKVLKCYSISR